MAMNYVTFNQDATRLVLGTAKGFKVYQCDPEFRLVYESGEDNISLVEEMFSTSLVAIVTAPRRLIIRNWKVS
jgi:autophagy-related protein 18